MRLLWGWDMILFFDRKRCTTVYDSNGREDRAFVGEDGTFLLKNVLTIVNVRSVISYMIPNTNKIPIKNLLT